MEIQGGEIMIINKLENGAFFRVDEFDPEVWQKRAEVVAGKKPTHVEIVLDGYSLTERYRRILSQIAKSIGEIPLLVHAPYEDVSLVTPWQDLFSLSVDRMQWTARLARSVGASAVTVHAGIAPVRWADDDDALIARLATRLSIFRELVDGIPVLLESATDARIGRLKQVGSLVTLNALSEFSPESEFTLDMECVSGTIPPGVAERVRVAHLHHPQEFELFEGVKSSLPRLEFVTQE
jgi:hypothetical protein